MVEATVGEGTGVPERVGPFLYALGMAMVSLFSGVLLLFSLGSTAYLREENYEAFAQNVLDGHRPH